MVIPEEVREKLDYDPSWTVQHEDIIQIMDEVNKGKPWSRYMIQQHLDSDPSKKTVQDRLDELVELEILKKYEYTNQTLYDLAYSPLVTDGGRLKDASWKELATFRDQNGIRDLSTASIIMSFVLFGFGILTEIINTSIEVTFSGNVFVDSAIILYMAAFVLLFLLVLQKRILGLIGFAE